MLYRLIVLLLLVCFASPVVAELELDENGLPKEDMLRAFEPYAGRWVGQIRNEATKFIPEPMEVPGVQEGKYVLDKSMFQMRAVGKFEGETTESIFLYGYDFLEKSYICWHYQQGALGLKYKVEWADDGQSYTHISMDDEEIGYSVRTRVELDGAKAIRWKSKVKTNEGELVVNQTGELTPEQGEVDFPKRKPDEDKLAMFRPYAGKWDSVTKGKVTEVVEEPYEVSGQWVQSDILGGDGIHMSGSADLEGKTYTYEWFYLYDAREEAYVAWFHDSRGVHTKMYGNWDAKKKTMTWTLDDPDKHGVMVTIVDDLTDPDKVGFTFKMEDSEGALIVEEIGVGTRAVEE